MSMTIAWLALIFCAFFIGVLMGFLVGYFSQEGCLECGECECQEDGEESEL